MVSVDSEIVVSVCMVTYNHEKYIAQAIDSILMQVVDFKYEIVIGEDCSTDNTRKIIMDYAAKYPDKFKLLLHEKNIGMMPNVKATLKACSGKYIASLEGDDYWTDPEKLQIQITEMNNHPECHLSFHPADEIIDNVLSGKVWGDHGAKNKVFTDIEMLRGIGNVFCPSASMVMCREVLDPLPPFFATAPVGDNFIQFLGSLNGGALYIARKMSIYRRENLDSWSSTMTKLDKLSVESLIENRSNHIVRYIESLDEMANFIDNKYREEVDKIISENLLSLSILYLTNDMDKDFRRIIVQSYDTYKPVSFLQIILYRFRRVAWLAKKLIKLHTNQNIIKVYLHLKNIKK